MAANTPGFCTPTSAPGTRVRAYLAELLQISPAELRPVAIPMQVALLSGTTTLSDTNYVVAADQDLYLYSIAGYLSPNDLSAEPTAMLTWLNLEPSERYLVKAMNCAVQMENVTRNYKVFDGREAMLSSLMPPFGMPLQWPVETPFCAPAKHVLKATFTLQDTASDVVGASTDYGILLSGVLVPHANRR